MEESGVENLRLKEPKCTFFMYHLKETINVRDHRGH
jgi:hypothetical protein